VSSCRETCSLLAWQGNSWIFYVTNNEVMWQCTIRLSCNKVKVKERNWVRIPLAMFGNHNSKRMSDLHTWSLLNLEFVWNYVDGCYIQGHVFDRYNIWCLVIDRYVKGIGVPWDMAQMCSATRQHAWHNKVS